jgi:hypothetical protein
VDALAGLTQPYMTVVEGYPLLIIYDKDGWNFLLNKELIN